jgi:predicted RNA-binding protein with PUA-like domain
MHVGDGVFIYHSSTAVPGIAGLAQVATEAYPDPTQFQKKSEYFDPKSTREAPRWSLVDVRFVRKLARVIPLEEIRGIADRLDSLALLQRGSRLSVSPVSAAQWKTLLSLE